uniref:(northern house mosquito) hypothetical protein n=1 Tax=Culex pipiens TaxID=7175 RepID=A0A8D7ZT72_CULPI
MIDVNTQRVLVILPNVPQIFHVASPQPNRLTHVVHLDVNHVVVLAPHRYVPVEAKVEQNQKDQKCPKLPWSSKHFNSEVMSHRRLSGAIKLSQFCFNYFTPHFAV